MRIAALADDVTGATDLAGSWRNRGLRSVVVLGEPEDRDRVITDESDAVVYAAKIRSVPPEQARLAAARVGKALSAIPGVQVYDKYCSTFDSTPDGNIGPIADALADATGARRAVVVPSMPGNGRTVYQGHLFVHDQLLSDSPMRSHPLNPMHDSNVVRLLQSQTCRSVGLIPLATVRRGAEQLRRALDDAQAEGSFYVVVDAIDTSDLEIINTATTTDPLVTGGSGLALGAERSRAAPAPLKSIPGHRLILAGSASSATRAQVEVGEAAYPSLALDLSRVIADRDGHASEISSWVREQWAADAERPVLVHSAAASLNGHAPTRDQAEGVESVMGLLTRQAYEDGARQILVAGGETSGAAIRSLGVRYLEMGDEVDPGVSWTRGVAFDPDSPESRRECNLMLKSGNFGREGLFVKAWDHL